jgi:hypothetical protein
MKSAILFITYKRFETALKVFEVIRDAKPPRLYFVSNAPNPESKDDYLNVIKVRKILNMVDWPCNIYKLFRKEHLAAKYSISSAIDWFFENEEEGIILEDDVLPIPSFFLYCDELLERYRYDEKVGVISGCNLFPKSFIFKDSYFFSRYNHVWGWASWRRVWQHYDVTMKTWPEWRDSGGLASISGGNKLFESYWTAIFNNTFNGRVNTWDYQWTYCCWFHGVVTALPSNNQTYNLGFGHPDAVNTTGNAPKFIKESIPESLVFPLRHPISVERLVDFDILTDKWSFGITNKEFIVRNILQIPLIGNLLRKIKRILLKKA